MGWSYTLTCRWYMIFQSWTSELPNSGCIFYVSWPFVPSSSLFFLSPSSHSSSSVLGSENAGVIAGMHRKRERRVRERKRQRESIWMQRLLWGTPDMDLWMCIRKERPRNPCAIFLYCCTFPAHSILYSKDGSNMFWPFHLPGKNKNLRIPKWTHFLLVVSQKWGE